MITMPFVLVDGLEPTTSAMAPFALVNYGHFTAMQVRHRRVRGVQLHLDRLASAHRTLFGTELDDAAVRPLLARAVADHPDCYLRVTVIETAEGRPSVLTVVRPPTERQPRATSLLPVPWTRPVADVKHVGTFPQIHLARVAEQQGYDDALLVDADEAIAETTIANIAFVSDDSITWPTGPALEGITWQLLEPILPEHGFATTRAAVSLDELDRFRAAVLVNSIGVEAVARIGTHEFTDSERTAAQLDEIYRTIPATEL